MELEKIVGKTFTEISVNNDKTEIIFTEADGAQYKMYHRQDCCESVYIDELTGDINDLVGSPITMAKEETNTGNPKSTTWGEGEDAYVSTDESSTWTFYKLATVKGYVDIKWYGVSNGYYSESVDFIQIGGEEDYGW